MSPLVAYHATRRACREGIAQNGLLCWEPSESQPYGVYVFRLDGSFDHMCKDSMSEWTFSRGADLWRVEYIGPMTADPYVLNGMILLDHAPHVTLVTGSGLCV